MKQISSIALPKPTSVVNNTWNVIGQASGLSPGLITQIRFDGDTVDPTWRIRITIDNQRIPQVDVLLSEFFGYKRLPNASVFRTKVWGQSYNLTPTNSGLGAEFNLPIPYLNSFKIEVWPNASGGLIFSTIEYQTGLDSTLHGLYLFADTINIEAPGLVEVTWFESRGQCQVAGLFMDLYVGNANHWPLEGLVRFYYGETSVLGYTSPGTEDFFGSSFYFNDGIKAFDSNGLNYNTGGATAAWRWFFDNGPADQNKVKVTWTNGWNYLGFGNPGTSYLNVTRFYYGRAPSLPFDPATLTNGFYATVNSSGVYSDLGSTLATTDGTLVRQWNSFNGLKAIQNTSNLRPILKTGVGNSKNVLRFTGTQYLQVTDNALLDLVGSISMYAVVSFADYNDNRYIMERGAGANPWYFLFYLAATGLAGGFTSGAGVHYDFANPPTANSLHIVGATYDAGSGHVIIDVDGIELANNENSSGSPISGVGDLFIGSDRAVTAGKLLVGDLAAIFIGPSLSATDRAKLRQAWRIEWGTP